MLDIEAKQLRQVCVESHKAAMLSMGRVQLKGSSEPMLACGFTDGSILLYGVSRSNDTFKTKLLFDA